jgi:biotin operon repressor
MEPGPLEERALAIIRARRVSAQGLAMALGVSQRTAARAVAALRTRGLRVSSVREGRRWYYTLPEPDASTPPRPDSLLELVGFVRTGLRDGARNHDHYLSGMSKKG